MASLGKREGGAKESESRGAAAVPLSAPHVRGAAASSGSEGLAQPMAQRERLEGRLYRVGLAVSPRASEPLARTGSALSPRPPAGESAGTNKVLQFPYRRRLRTAGEGEVPPPPSAAVGKARVHPAAGASSSLPSSSGLGTPRASRGASPGSDDEDGREAAEEEEEESKRDGMSPLRQAALSAAARRRYKRGYKSFMERMIETEPGCAHMGEADSFLYFVRAAECTAYTLELLRGPRASAPAGADVYMVSSTGVTTQYSDGSSEFVSVAQFEREFYLWQRIKAIPFFRRYRVWKSFKEWRRNVRGKKVTMCKARLQEQLFILHPLLSSSLLQLRKLCFDAAAFRLFAVSATRTYELAEFADVQRAQRDLVRGQLERFSAAVREVLAQTCAGALRAFLHDNGFASLRGAAERSFGPATALALASAAAAAVAPNAGDKSYRDEAERPITFTERAGMRTQCRKLTKYIRLADFFVIDTLLVLAMSSTAELLHSIQSRQLIYRAGNDERQRRLAAEAASSGHPPPSGQQQQQQQQQQQLQRLQPPPQLQLQPQSQQLQLQQQRPPQQQQQHQLLDQQHEQQPRGNKKLTGKQQRAEQERQVAASKEAERAAAENTAQLKVVPVFVVKMSADIDSARLEEEDAEELAAALVFHPSAEEFRLETESTIFDTLKVVTDPEPLLSHPDFELYAQPSLEDGVHGGERVDLEMMIVEDPHFQRMVEDISGCLRGAFEEAQTFTRGFLPLLGRYAHNEKVRRTLSVPAFSARPIEDFQYVLAHYSGALGEFEHMPVTSDIGIVRVDAKRLKALFVPSPQLCLAQAKAVVPEVLRLKMQQSLAEMRAANETLARVSYSVDEFVEQLSFLRSTVEDLEAVNGRFAFATQLFRLCLDCGVPLEEEDNTAVYMLKETSKALQANLQAAEESVPEQTAHFAKELEEQGPRLRASAGALRTQLAHVSIFNPDAPAADVLAHLAKAQVRADELLAERERFGHFQTTLGVAPTTLPELEEIRADLAIKTKLWRAVEAWGKLAEFWCATPLAAVDAAAISTEVDKFQKTALQAERALAGNVVAPTLREKVLDFKRAMPVIIALRCADLQERHWERIHEVLGYVVYGAEDLDLGTLIRRRAMDRAAELEGIATGAVQEAVLVGMVNKVAERWKTAEFTVLQYKETKDHIVGGVDEIMVGLDDSLVTINTVLGSRYVGPIRAQVEDWQRRLVLFQETLEEWLNCQRNWMYLESIFSAPDIQRQLPQESKLFIKVDASFRENMRRAADDPNCFKCCTRPGLREALHKHNAALESIQKSLEDYLETKRAAFARFYFLSNDELLQILAQTKDPQAVQPHLRKCFDALVELDFGDQPKSVDIKAMLSPEKERIELGKNLKARGNVEDWLTAVESNMRVSLQKLMKAGLLDFFERPRPEWVRGHAGQVVATAAQIAWANGTECAIANESAGAGQQLLGDAFWGEHVASLDAWLRMNIDDLNDLTGLVRSNLTPRERMIIVALVTTDVHARDIVQTLCDEGVTSTGSFTWQQQLRYYWDKGDVDDCVVRQSNSVIRYAYEYEGCTTRLVITPLTDRCWMTLTGALRLKLGGSPSGPAGTGKTESSKDLAKALGIQCIVFNCSDQIDYKMMAKLFSGLAQAGCWTCLDEFNRIDIEVLSVIAQQLLTLRQGRLAEAASITFEGRDIALKEHHVVITMNPGYAGRTELPDNLKVLFRPVAMMVPDYSLIAEIMLFAEGFSGAKILSVKMTKMYSLCSEQLSQQCHYDYGLRAVKSVLVMAGGLKRGNPKLSEDVVLIRAMRDSNLPKFLGHDVPLFFGILADLFPGVQVPYQDTGALQETIESCLEEAHLQVVPAHAKKVIQLYEIMQVRFGVTLVGPTGGGKSTAYKMLAKAMTRLAAEPHHGCRAVHATVLNPKCIAMGELYGEFNELTQEWTDGLASSIMRGMVGAEGDDNRWIVFDGPIDALWIESMNTVLDDNMTLCLANGERIKLRKQMKCVFEVMDLEVASPATVSRLGVLFMTPDNLGWLPQVQTWLKRDMHEALGGVQGAEAPALRERLLHLVSTVLANCLKFLRKSCAEPIPTVDIQVAAAFCEIFKALWLSSPFCREVARRGPAGEGPLVTIERERLMRLADRIFAFSLVWSVGGAIDAANREAFDELARREFEKGGLGLIGLSVKGLVFDYFVDMTAEQLRRFDEVVPEFTYSPAMPFSQIVVPTVDTVRFSFLVEKLTAANRPVFITGVTGTGKTVMVQALLAELAAPPPAYDAKAAADDESVSRAVLEQRKLRAARRAALGFEDALAPVMPVMIGFSAQTSAKVTQLSIEAKMEKKRKGLLGAPTGTRAVVFVDDVNMPKVETYGAQPPIELLRQLLDSGGFFDRDKLFWKDVQDTVLTVAAAPPGGGRNAVTPRFVRHFSVLCLAPASREAMLQMFSCILSGHLQEGFAPDVRGLGRAVVESTVEVFHRISHEMLPTPQKSHYTFNLRDLSKVVQGILMVAPAHCATGEGLARLWAHEAMRVFHDRLVNVDDKLWFTQLVLDLLKRNFQAEYEHNQLFGSEQSEEEPAAPPAVSPSAGSPKPAVQQQQQRKEYPPLIFCDFLRGVAGVEDDGEAEEAGGEAQSAPSGAQQHARPYEPLGSMAQATKALEDALEDHNMTFPTKMNLVFFRDAVEHVSRIARVLRQKRGNALLVGVGGSGKQSLSRLAIFMAGAKCVQIEITKGYGQSEFRGDLKSIMHVAGVRGRPVGFLFTDSQIISDGFLEDINNLLNSGEVPNLYEPEEVDSVMAAMGAVCRAKGIPESRDNCRRLFVERVRDNLHVVLCMSPVGSSLRVWCRQFPSLINCTTIDWFLEWPQSALNSVARRFLHGVDLPSEGVRAALVRACTMVHTSISAISRRFLAELGRTVYTTPRSYLDLIELYVTMLREKRAEMHLNCSRLGNGVVKLEETNDMVQRLKVELSKLAPVLERKSLDAEQLLKEVAKEQAAASLVKAKVAFEEAEVTQKAAQVAEVQADAQRDLDKAMPALAAAIQSLDALDKKDISEMKSFLNPPAAVQNVMEAVLVLLGEKPDWDTAKRVMTDPKFMDNLKGYDKDNIPAASLRKLRKYVEDPNFSVDAVTKVSKAASSLCMWVHAMDVYSVVARAVAPKRQRLAEMNKTLEEANAMLADKQAALKTVVDKVDALQAMCDATLAEKNRLAAEAATTRARLERAEKLTSGLAQEGVRWRETVTALAARQEALVGDIFLAAACVSFYGAFTGTYRDELVALWQERVQAMQIPCSGLARFSLVAAIGDPVVVREWQLSGLPTDEVSTNSALLATRGRRWPLMIDPQMQANKWVKQKEAKQGLEVTKMTSKNLLQVLESAVRNGRPLLVEDAGEQLDPGLEPILQRAIFKQNGRTLIRLGDTDVDYEPSFQLYITTKVANPHYLPEVSIKVTLINFTVTLEGLEDQLLGTLIWKEKPDIEERKNRLLFSMAADQKQLKDIEDKILKMLSESKGDILDDEELINTLADSKTTSAIITERVEESIRTNAEVSQMRNSYRPVARRGSLLYFVIADLARIDPMYQYSLEYFVRLFKRCVDDSQRDANLDKRLVNIAEFQNAFVFKNICRGLFEQHKLLFAFLVAVQILRNSGNISGIEWNLFLRGPQAMLLSNTSRSSTTSAAKQQQQKMPQSEAPDEERKGLPEGLSPTMWQTLCVLDRLVPVQFRGISADVLKQWALWRAWAYGEAPQDSPMPHFVPSTSASGSGGGSNGDDGDADPTAAAPPPALTLFQKLLLVKTFREEKTVLGIRRFVALSLGERFVSPPTTSMEEICADMDNRTPCIFVLSQGADPTALLLRYAEKRGCLEKLKVISLGQGQGVKAERLIAEAARVGNWVLLQNCHLAKSWMPSLESIINSFADGAPPALAASKQQGQQGQMQSASPTARTPLHPELRLFLTSFPAVYFPVAVLQNGLKLTNEPPRGLQANLLRTFEAVLVDDVLGRCVTKPQEYRKVLFGLGFFHAIVQERRKFGPLGWNIRYEFDDSDLETSAEQLSRFLDEAPGGAVPWDALRYVTGQINYGGRVTDDWDRRCIMSVLGRYYHPDIIAIERFPLAPGGLYEVPRDTDHAGYLSYIRSLPAMEGTEVYGLHANANITLELQESGTMIGSVLEIQPRAATGEVNMSPDAVVKALALNMSLELPKRLDPEVEAGPSTMLSDPETGLLKPLATFVLQEVVKFNRLIDRIEQSLAQLVQAMDGRVVMSLALDRMHVSFFNGQVPELFSQVAYPSLRPLASWYADLRARVAFIREWLKKGEPVLFALPVFFFPQGFLTSVLQTHARRYRVAINTLSFDFSIYAAEECDIDVRPGNGVIVSGLSLEGARWDRASATLADSLPRQMYAPMQPIHFLPTPGLAKDPKQYQCPVYKTSKRAGVLSTTGLSTNFVVSIALPTDKDPEVWIWRGAAFLLNLND